jgi:hypothetical protein
VVRLGDVGSNGQRMFSNVGLLAVDDFGEVGPAAGVVALGINVRELVPLDGSFQGDLVP